MRFQHFSLASWVTVMTLCGGLQAGAQPNPATSQQKRIDLLEEQVRIQNQQLKQMQKELQELKNVRHPAPSPVASPTPANSTGATPILDESVPPVLTPGPETPPIQAIPEGGPMIDDSVPPPASAPPTTSSPSNSTQSARTAASTSFFNPAISAVGLFEARTSNDKTNQFNNQFSVREVEIALQAAVDPYSRYDIFLTAGNGDSVSVEEAYGTIFNLPLGFQAKAGKFKAAFGRSNQLHTHAFPQIDRPEVINLFLGEEGLSGPGLSLSTILPMPWYSEVFLEAFSSDDNPNLFSSEISQKPIYNISWRNLFDLREDLTLEAGVSGAFGKTDSDQLKDTKLAGAHLSLKYKPLRQLGQFAITWESEYLTETQRVPLSLLGSPYGNGTRTENRCANGWYSYLDVQADRNWFFGLRYDWTHLPIDPSKVEYGWTPYLGYRFSEFSSLRLQYKNLQRSWESVPLQEVFLQWNIVMGPHGAHKY